MRRLATFFAAALVIAGCASHENKSNDDDMVKGFGHVALYTAQFEETIRFYQEAFGAEDMGQFSTMNRMCWLKLGDSILEICETDGKADGHFDHIAIGCSNVDSLYESALKAGGEGQVQPKDIRLGLKTPLEARIAFVRGINGERIELFEEK